jgi:hypothetical protein
MAQEAQQGEASVCDPEREELCSRQAHAGERVGHPALHDGECCYCHLASWGTLFGRHPRPLLTVQPQPPAGTTHARHHPTCESGRGSGSSSREAGRGRLRCMTADRLRSSARRAASAAAFFRASLSAASSSNPSSAASSSGGRKTRGGVRRVRQEARKVRKERVKMSRGGAGAGKAQQ